MAIVMVMSNSNGVTNQCINNDKIMVICDDDDNNSNMKANEGNIMKWKPTMAWA